MTHSLTIHGCVWLKLNIWQQDSLNFVDSIQDSRMRLKYWRLLCISLYDTSNMQGSKHFYLNLVIIICLFPQKTGQLVDFTANCTSEYYQLSVLICFSFIYFKINNTFLFIHCSNVEMSVLQQAVLKMIWLSKVRLNML